MREQLRRFRAWVPPLEHPVVLAMFIALVVRGVGLAWHTFGQDLNGQPMVLVPMMHFPATFDYHYAVILGQGALLMLLWRGWAGARRALVLMSGLVFSGTVVLGQIDFAMLRHVGRRFSPSVLETYGNAGLFTSEVVEPLRADAWHTLGMLGLMAGGLLALALVGWRGLRVESVPRWSWPWWAGLVALTAYLGSVPMQYNVMRTLMRPPEVVFWHALMQDDVTPAPESMEAMRAALLPARGNALGDEHYPLMRRSSSTVQAVDDPPDIIIIAVESLRGANLGFVSGERPSVTPELDALAGAGVALPHFIANGFPSAVGFMAVHTGSLPHRSKTITTAFTERHFDALPVRLGALGYQRTAIWGGNAMMDNELAWSRRWYDTIDYQNEINRWDFKQRRSDAETVDALIEHLRRVDEAKTGRPQFYYVATAGMHEPFTAEPFRLEDVINRSEAAPYDPVTMGDREKNYRTMLRELDRQVGRLADFLATRARRDNTVLLICGDHGVLLNEAVDYARRTYPVDGFVWTGALLHGSPTLVGPSRVVSFAASQVDVMPTLLALAGDDGPTAAIGVNLLDAQADGVRQAIAVREDGYRLDRDGWTLLVNAHDPSDFEVRPSFGMDAEGDSPFSVEDARALHEGVRAWSWLIEQDRVWPATVEVMP